jgi:hypothetical protein
MVNGVLFAVYLARISGRQHQLILLIKLSFLLGNFAAVDSL